MSGLSGNGSAVGVRDARYRLLDAWRGLACLMIVIHHAGYALHWSDASGSPWRWWMVFLARRMSLGVPLFFVISGYCIAASAEASARRGDNPWSFLSRRVWRIYPPYWAALAGFALILAALEMGGLGRYYRSPIAVMLDAPHSLEWRQWLGNITLTETWRPHLFGPARNIYTGVAWSLCFEEQFYLICFLALWLVPGGFFRAIGMASIAIAAVWMQSWWNGSLENLSGTFPLLWHLFAVGLAVYYRLNVAEDPRAKNALDLGMFALFAAGLQAGGRSGRETAAAACFGLVLVALRRWDARSASLTWLEPFRACGRRCYSIYLAHLPAGIVGNQLLYELGVSSFWGRVLVMIPLVSIAGIASGWAFHAAIESRFLGPPPALRRRFGWRPHARTPRRGPYLTGAASAAT